MVLKTPKKEPRSQSSPPIPPSSSTHNANSQKQSPSGDASSSPVIVGEEECLRTASRLHRAEVLRRRSRRLHQLASTYRRHYWSLVEELTIKHRDYYWEYGKSPLEKLKFKGQEASAEEEEEEEVETGEERMKCGFSGCKAKAMALTKFCHQHILADPKQTLYKPCNFVIKSPQGAPIICGKTVLKAANPSLCQAHYQRSQKGISQALKRAGVTLPSSSNKPIPKFSLIISEAVHQIQMKRLSGNNSKSDEPKKEQALG
ncbi:INO80 complex subunit D [Rhynchospora pubera]|uniref:KAT8 regulatory NSL complex subunit 2 n=1 Tax=Rhynchospora pubera TaxID=906938 RepID=A0AAV8CAR0_9POAL|nr:INO80 complex subunit D [Rhynchospora pubera]